MRRLAAAVLGRLSGSFGSPSRRSPMMFFCTWVVPPAMRPPGAPSERGGRAALQHRVGAGQVGLEHGGVEHQLRDPELGEAGRHGGHRALTPPHGLQRPAAGDELGQPVPRHRIVGALERAMASSRRARVMPAEPM